MKFNCKLIFAIIIFCDFSNNSSFTLANAIKSSLKFVQIITRHGDKNQDTPYPNDPYKDDSYWPGGRGQLTDKGKKRMYDLGLYFRERYDGLIGANYSPEDIYMLSSDYDRTIRSAMALLAGLYKESNLNSTWNPDIKWDPIPVHTVAKEHDRIFEVTESCPKLDTLFFDLLNNSEFALNYIKNNKEDLEFFSQNAGVDFTHDLYYFLKVVLDLSIQTEHNLALPSWATTLMATEQYKSFPVSIFKRAAQNNDWLRLRIGTLLSNIIQNMEGASKDDASKVIPMRMWSTHDRILLEFVVALQLYELDEIPPYGSSIIFELHEKEKGKNVAAIQEYFVQLLIKNTTSGEAPVLVEIAGCSSPCSLDTFKAIVEKFIPEDWNAECQLDNKTEKAINREERHISNAALYGGLILLCTLFACILFIGYTFYKNPRIYNKYERL